MKTNNKILLCALCMIILLVLSGCKTKKSQSSDDTEHFFFTAEVVSLSDDTVLVRPEDDTKEDKLAAQIYVPVDTTIVLEDGSLTDAAALLNASRVQITYDGVLDNSDPASITNCYEIRILN